MSDADLETLKLLKSSIELKIVTDAIKIFKYEDNSFLAYQYAREIAKVRNLDIQYVDSFEEIVEESTSAFSFEEQIKTLRIYSCDKFECSQDVDLSSLKDVIIICKSTSLVASFIYNFPKLEDWQILAYMKANCPGLNDDELNWLYNITSSINKNNENIYRISNEIDKIKCFPSSEQEEVFHEISSSGGYSDLTPLTIFNLTNYILKRDYYNVSKILEEIDSMDVEGVGLITILHKNFKQIIDIQLGKNVTYESLGLSLKQFKAIEYNCGKYSSSELIRVFKFITELDYKLKSGKLDLSNQKLIDYILCGVMS